MMGRQPLPQDPFDNLNEGFPMQQLPVNQQALPQPPVAIPTNVPLQPEASIPTAPAPKPLSEIEQLAQAYQEQQGLQAEAIKQAEEQLAAARSKPQQMDLSPLIALAEGWSQQPIGLLRAYQKPEDQAKTVQALQEAVLKARGGAAELARMRAKDVSQLSQQEKQLKSSEELKRAQIAAMGQQREGKQDLSVQKFQRESEKEYTKTYGEPLRNLAVFGGKVSALENKLREKGDPFWGASSAEIDSLSSSINTDYNRDIAQLGALAGADLELIKAATGQGLGVKEYVTRQMKGGAQARINLLRMLKTDVEKRSSAYKNEVMNNSDYEFVANRLNNDLQSIDKAIGTNISGSGQQPAAPVQNKPINEMTLEELRSAAKAKKESEGKK